jgi:hypothetical protein
LPVVLFSQYDKDISIRFGNRALEAVPVISGLAIVYLLALYDPFAKYLSTGCMSWRSPSRRGNHSRAGAEQKAQAMITPNRSLESGNDGEGLSEMRRCIKLSHVGFGRLVVL